MVMADAGVDALASVAFKKHMAGQRHRGRLRPSPAFPNAQRNPRERLWRPPVRQSVRELHIGFNAITRLVYRSSCQYPKLMIRLIGGTIRIRAGSIGLSEWFRPNTREEIWISLQMLREYDNFLPPMSQKHLVIDKVSIFNEGEIQFEKSSHPMLYFFFSEKPPASDVCRCNSEEETRTRARKS